MAEESFKLQFLQTMSALMISAFGLVGLFLILASLIRPLRAYLSKKFFI